MRRYSLVGYKERKTIKENLHRRDMYNYFSFYNCERIFGFVENLNLIQTVFGRTERERDREKECEEEQENRKHRKIYKKCIIVPGYPDW